ncbi:hypothetical protein RclHR1_15750002 [Rhizophagus clarus]|uniref:FAD/NAD(P)-binding domain-containing protein n=1 Tax=Rhizophagus clarus TaxID=94130 RepID=A0A2Z6QK25_9GLOM|nr:hypothetical protein RclHR1_15750002 [Rhizophagus clarus]
MYYVRSKLVESRGALHIHYRLLLSGPVQLSNTNCTSKAISNYLYKYPHISRKFVSTETVNTEKATIKSSKFGRKVITVSSLIISAAAVFAILNHKHAEAENNKQEKIFSRVLKRGGPKNLLIADRLIDEGDSDINKPRLVILGSGWGAISVLKELEKDKYHVTVVSPRNYFLFTPLLPSATVGTLETRSLLEPIRSLIKSVSAYFLEAKATDICFSEKLIELSPDSDEPFYIPYDKLVIAVGSKSITYGIEGIEHCHFLKSINDARMIRKKIMDNFEKASLPTTSPEEKKSLLSFVVCGGGKIYFVLR